MINYIAIIIFKYNNSNQATTYITNKYFFEKKKHKFSDLIKF